MSGLFTLYLKCGNTRVNLAGVASSLTIIFLALFAFPQACQHVRHMRANRQEVGRSEDACLWQHREEVIRLPDGWNRSAGPLQVPKNLGPYFPGSSNRNFRRGQPRPTAAPTPTSATP